MRFPLGGASCAPSASCLGMHVTPGRQLAQLALPPHCSWVRDQDMYASPMHAGMVEDVEPRSSELGDPAVANVDQVMIVFSLVDPPWDGQMATRFLVCAERAGVPVCLVLNKADLAKPEQTAAIVKEVQLPSVLSDS